MPKVKFVKEKQEIEVAEGENLRKAALKAGIQVYPGLTRFFNCMGNGHCGTCSVIVKEGKENLSKKGLVENLNLKLGLISIGHEEDMRLSCQCKVQGDCVIETRPSFNLGGENFWQKPYPNK